MPRPTAAPGKKENYNLDYQRFNKFDGDEDESGETVKRPGEADAAAGMPDMRDMLRTMPPELQEAFYLMQVAKQNGDTVAQQRASALALEAVQKGGPEVRAEFMKNVAKEMPEIAGRLSKEMGGDVPGADATSLLQGLQNDLAVSKAGMKFGGLEDAGDPAAKIDTLRENMLEGQKATRTEMDNLQKKQEELEKIKNPEDFFKFMEEEGMSQEDLQRIFSGDEQHMQSRFNETVEKTMSKGVDKDKAGKSADAMKNVEELHSTLFGTTPEDAPAEAPEPERPKRRAPSPPKEPEITIPMYRLQYQKDEAGKYTVVELKCTLPGVADMSAVDLDVSERHLRLNTRATDTAPRYAVNAGPFPVLIDPSRARAKYSKKREELSITVPAKAS